MATGVFHGSSGALKDLDGHGTSDRPDGQPFTASDAAAAHDPHRRSGRTRTVRVRDGFFDSSLLHYVSLDDPASKDAIPSRRSPKPQHHPRTKHHIEEGDDEDWDGMSVGPDYQATKIPACRPRPAQPSAHEARFLQLKPLYVPEHDEVQVGDKATKTRAARAGVTVPMPPVGVAASSSDFRYKWRWCKDNDARCSLLSAAVSALDKQLGPDMVKKLNLGRLGYKLRETWQPQEELLFALGMCDKYRMFKYIRQCYLFNRTVHELNAYYHNVWKTRSSELADEFLTLREEEATRLEYAAYVDKVRDQLVAMWDRKTMGDMPKLVKDLAAAAQAERAAAAAGRPLAAGHQRSIARGHSRAMDHYYYSDSESEADAGAMSDGSTSSGGSDKRAARRRSQQRKRAAAGAFGGGAGRPAKRAVANGGYGAAAQQYFRGHLQNGRPYFNGLPAPAGLGLGQWLHPGLPLAQRPRTAAQFGLGHGASTAALPDMPRAPPRPEGPNDEEAVGDWLHALPEFRSSLLDHLKAVDQMTDQAIEECKRYIKHLDKQRTMREEEAHQYLDVVLRQGRQLLVKIGAEEAEQRRAQLAQRQSSAAQQDHQQQQYHYGADTVSGMPALQVPAGGTASQEPGQQQQQQHGDVDMADAPSHRQLLQQDDAAAPDAVRKDLGAPAPRSAMGPPPPRPSLQQQQQQQAAADEHKQQQQQQDKLQTELDTVAGVDIGAGAALPFPGGPTGNWGLGQWAGMGTTTTAPPAYSAYLGPHILPTYAAGSNHNMMHKPVPRPYMRH